MELLGKMYKIYPKEDITFNDGKTTVKGGFVVMRDTEYPSPVYFECFGPERIAAYSCISIGTPVAVFFYAESHETKNGTYTTNLRCTGIATITAQNAPVHSDNQHTNEAAPSGLPFEEIVDSDENDLIF